MFIYLDFFKARNRPQTARSYPSRIEYILYRLYVCGGGGSGVKSSLPGSHPNSTLLSSLIGVNTLSTNRLTSLQFM